MRKQRETERTREAVGALHMRSLPDCMCGSMKLQQQQQQIVINRHRERTWSLSQLQPHMHRHVLPSIGTLVLSATGTLVLSIIGLLAHAHALSHQAHMHTQALSTTQADLHRQALSAYRHIDRQALSPMHTRIWSALSQREAGRKRRCAPKTSNEFRFLTAL